MRTLCRALSSVFFIGYLPAPGAWGSAAGFALAWYLPQYFFPIFIALTLLGYGLSLKAEGTFASKDPLPFVMDEVCGMMLAVAFLPKTFALYFTAYVLFRILDVWKPGPIRALEKIPHPFSIMNDDMLAGLIANLLLQVASRLLG